MTKTDVIDRSNKKVYVFTDGKDRQEGVDKTAFLGTLGYKVELETYEPTVEDNEGTHMSNTELIKRLLRIRETNTCTVYVESISLIPYFGFMDVKYVKDFEDFINACPMRVIYMGDVQKKDFERYVQKKAVKCVMPDFCSYFAKLGARSLFAHKLIDTNEGDEDNVHSTGSST